MPIRLQKENEKLPETEESEVSKGNSWQEFYHSREALQRETHASNFDLEGNIIIETITFIIKR